MEKMLVLSAVGAHTEYAATADSKGDGGSILVRGMTEEEEYPWRSGGHTGMRNIESIMATLKLVQPALRFPPVEWTTADTKGFGDRQVLITSTKYQDSPLA